MYDNNAFMSFISNTLLLIYNFFMINWWLQLFIVVPIVYMVITLVKSFYNKD